MTTWNHLVRGSEKFSKVQFESLEAARVVWEDLTRIAAMTEGVLPGFAAGDFDPDAEFWPEHETIIIPAFISDWPELESDEGESESGSGTGSGSRGGSGNDTGTEEDRQDSEKVSEHAEGE